MSCKCNNYLFYNIDYYYFNECYVFFSLSRVPSPNWTRLAALVSEEKSLMVSEILLTQVKYVKIRYLMVKAVLMLVFLTKDLKGILIKGLLFIFFVLVFFKWLDFVRLRVYLGLHGGVGVWHKKREIRIYNWSIHVNSYNIQKALT